MNRQSWFLLAVLGVLGGGYAFWFTDWFATRQIQIEVSTRPSGRGRSETGALPTVFLLDQEYPLTHLAVRPAGSNAAPGAPPAWVLQAPRGSTPVRGFAYGQAPEGMKTLTPPAGLQPGTAYRIEVAAGRTRGTREFTARGEESEE
ncbi:MAG: hypothetical protein ACKO3N_06725 [Verrucomicrobiota bacterium]